MQRNSAGKSRNRKGWVRRSAMLGEVPLHVCIEYEVEGRAGIQGLLHETLLYIVASVELWY
jgi:hypothetical protein